MVDLIKFLFSVIAFMSERKIPVLAVFAIGSIAALISGGPFLEAPLLEGLPVGNVLTVAALCSSACAAIAISRPGTVVRYFSVASLIVASAWLPASISLAGNLALNFSGLRGQIWVWLCLGTVVVVFVAVVWATIDHLIRRRLHRGSANAA